MKLLRILPVFIFFMGLLNAKAQKIMPGLNNLPQQSVAPTTGVIVVPTAIVENENLTIGIIYSWQITNLQHKEELPAFVEKFKKEPLVKSVTISREENSTAVINFSLGENITLKNCLALFAANGISFFKKANSTLIRPLVQ